MCYKRPGLLEGLKLFKLDPFTNLTSQDDSYFIFPEAVRINLTVIWQHLASCRSQEQSLLMPEEGNQTEES